MSKMINIYAGGVFINPGRTEVITSYGEKISIDDKEVVTAQLDHDTVVVGWIISQADTAVALVIPDSDDKNPYKGYVAVVFPNQILRFDENTYN